MKLNYEKLSVHIGDFIKWYCIFFTAMGLNMAIGIRKPHILDYVDFVSPIVVSLIIVLFGSDKAVWPIYKKGDQVWWSTNGTGASAKQKVIMTVIFLGIFIFLKVV